MPGVDPRRPVPVLDYQTPPRRPSLTYLPWGAAGIVVSLVNASTTTCMCGLFDWVSLPGNLVALGLLAMAFRRTRGMTSRRLLVYLMGALPLLFLCKNLMDILWLGHEALLR